MKPLLSNRGILAGLVVLAVSLVAREGFSQDPDFHIYLAFGQSNMEGNAKPEQMDKDVDPRFQLLPAVNWPDNSRTMGTWSTAVPPLCRSSTGLSPCDYFGRTMIDSLPENIKIGIINVSVAGCAMDMFMKNNYKSYIGGEADWMQNIAKEYDGNPYGRLVEMGTLAKKDGVIKGILLHQGETDAYKSGWDNKVKGVYNDLISDLNLDASKVPLLVGDLLSPSGAVQNLPRTLPNSYVISSQGLKGSDAYHFTAAGYRDFGKRYADKMLEIIEEQGGITGTTKSSYVKENAGYALNDMVFKNGKTSFSFEIPERAIITLKIYALNGKEIAEFGAAEYARGKHTLEFGKKVIHSGIFVVKMKTGTCSVSRTILASTN